MKVLKEARHCQSVLARLICHSGHAGCKQKPDDRRRDMLHARVLQQESQKTLEESEVPFQEGHHAGKFG